MKKTILYTFIAVLSFTFFPYSGFAATPEITKSATPADSAKTQNSLHIRLAEIEAMDKTDLNFQEKKALRKETRTIEKQLAPVQGGLYISAGALLIIIIILLIILI